MGNNKKNNIPHHRMSSTLWSSRQHFRAYRVLLQYWSNVFNNIVLKSVTLLSRPPISSTLHAICLIIPVALSRIKLHRECTLVVGAVFSCFLLQSISAATKDNTLSNGLYLFLSHISRWPVTVNIPSDQFDSLSSWKGLYKRLVPLYQFLWT